MLVRCDSFVSLAHLGEPFSPKPEDQNPKPAKPANKIVWPDPIESFCVNQVDDSTLLLIELKLKVESAANRVINADFLHTIILKEGHTVRLVCDDGVLVPNLTLLASIFEGLSDCYLKMGIYV